MSKPITNLARQLASQHSDFKLTDDDVRVLQDAIVEQGDVSAEDRTWLHAFLDSNNGSLFPEARRQEIMRFLDMPSRGLRNMAMGFERNDGVIDETEANVLMDHAESGGRLEGRGKYALESMPVAFNVDPRAAAAIRRRTEKLGLSEVVDRATADGVLSAEEFEKDVQPGIDVSPRKWSPDMQHIVEMRLGGDVSMAARVQGQLDARLAGRGFDIRNGQTVEGVNAINIGLPDERFAALAERANMDPDRALSIGVIDGGFDVTHPHIRDQIDVNEGEIPNNGIDDDNNGYRDDYDGANRMGLADGRPSGDSSANLNTMARFAYHGNQVLGIATRGTDRISGIAVADADGSVAGAIDYAVERGAKVINISQGFKDADTAQSILETIDKYPNVTFVHSAGNAGINVDTHPDRLEDLTGYDRPNLIHVAAADLDGNPLPDSNFGAETVHVAAQAKFYSASLPDSVHRDSGAGTYVFAGKTSQASPNIANTVAKMKLLAPSLPPDEIKSMLIASARTESSWSNRVASNGRVDADRAMSWAAATELVANGSTVDAAVQQLGLDGETATFVRAKLTD